MAFITQLKVHEQILIGDNIVITIYEIKGKRIRARIVAPKDIRISRRILEVKDEHAGSN